MSGERKLCKNWQEIFTPTKGGFQEFLGFSLVLSRSPVSEAAEEEPHGRSMLAI